MRARLAEALSRLPAPHFLVGALCSGLALSLLVRVPEVPAMLVAASLVLLSLHAGPRRAFLLAAALLATGWWWGSLRLDALDRSVLAEEIGRTALPSPLLSTMIATTVLRAAGATAWR